MARAVAKAERRKIKMRVFLKLDDMDQRQRKYQEIKAADKPRR